MEPDDTFQIIRFSDRSSTFGHAPVPATEENLAAARRFVDQLGGNGGTQMIRGLEAALDFPHDPRRLRVVSFLTDGYIGNETEIFAAIDKRLGAARIFSFGIGSSVNRPLIEGMARFGRGTAAYVGLRETPLDSVDEFFDQVRHAALTDVKIDWGALEVDSVSPSGSPDLFVGRRVMFTGRIKSLVPTTIRIEGRNHSCATTISIPFDPARDVAEHEGIPAVWARQRIRTLADRFHQTRDVEMTQEIEMLGLDRSGIDTSSPPRYPSHHG